MSQPDTKSIKSEVKERAWEIVRDSIVLGRDKQTSIEAITANAVAASERFLAACEAIEAGELKTELHKPMKKMFVEIQPMLSKNDEGFVFARKIVDGKRTNQLLPKERVPVDHFAFAPNAPLNHPANARFMPLGDDGEPLSEEAKLEIFRKTRAELLGFLGEEALTLSGLSVDPVPAIVN